MKRSSISKLQFTLKSSVLVMTAGLFLLSCAPDKDEKESFISDDPKMTARVIYGSDGRLDLYQVTDERLKSWADATVALVKSTDISVSGGVATLKGRNYGVEMNLCASEKYREQDTAAFCSGSLVGPDTVLTAGHCIQSMTDCSNTSFVFGFAVKSAGVLPKQVASAEVYRCKEVVKQVLQNSGADFAIIKLDRVVSGHTPLTVRPQGDVSAADGLVVIGYPVGLPLKVTTGGTVRSTASASHFVANLDTYGGNSGSAVINASTGQIEGVLVRGEQDFESRGSCTVSKVCAEGACRGEDVTKISVVRPFLPTASNPTTPPPVSNEEVFKLEPRLKIPDNTAAGVSSALSVTSIPKGRKVSVILNIQHTYIGDLVVKITSPDGKTALVHQRAGGGTDDLVKTIEVTSQLGLVAVAGTYKIFVQDLAAADVGTLVGWGIKFH